MSATVLYMSISLDGFIAGPDERPDNGLGEGGERLHDWFMMSDGAEGVEGWGSRARELQTKLLLRRWVHPFMLGKGSPADLLFRPQRAAPFELVDATPPASGNVVLTCNVAR